MNKIIIGSVAGLSIIAVYFIVKSPSQEITVANTKKIEKKSEPKIEIITKNIQKEPVSNTKISTPKKEIQTHNDTNHQENIILDKSVNNIKVTASYTKQESVESDSNQLKPPVFPAMINIKVDKKNLTIPAPTNSLITVTLQNKHNVKTKYTIDTTNLPSGKIVNVGEITPPDFKKANSQAQVNPDTTQDVQENIDTKVEESKTDNNPNNSVVPPPPPAI